MSRPDHNTDHWFRTLRELFDFAHEEERNLMHEQTNPSPLPAPMPAPDLHHFATGAVRSICRDKVRYDLIPWVGLRRLAETCAEGAEKYGVGNWHKGIPTHNLLGHALAHLADYLDGDRSEDHLAHAAWNIFVAMHNEERRRDMHELYPQRREETS